MPGGIFSGGQCNFADQGTNLASSQGTLLTASATINTKGPWSQLSASTPNDAIGFLASFNQNSSSGAYAIDIGVGASGSENVIVPNIIVNAQGSGAQPGTFTIFVPVGIPAGLRLAARCQTSTSGSATIAVQVMLLDGNISELPPCAGSGVQSFCSIATSRGIIVDPGATANTKGAWSQMTAATSYDISAMQLILDNEISDASAAYILLDIGVGVSGSEQVVVPNLLTGVSGVSLSFGSVAPPLIRRKIPAGSRIAIRAQSTQTGTSARKIGCTILGYPQ